MWIVIARTPRPDAPIWPGRIALAAVDAVAWPMLWVVAAWHAPAPTGLVAPVVSATAALAAIVRLNRALSANERYWFTTWRWGKIAAAGILIGWILQLTLVA